MGEDLPWLWGSNRVGRDPLETGTAGPFPSVGLFRTGLEGYDRDIYLTWMQPRKSSVTAPPGCRRLSIFTTLQAGDRAESLQALTGLWVRSGINTRMYWLRLRWNRGPNIVLATFVVAE